jgi:hypothetical protein
MPSAAGTTISPSTMAEPALMCQASSATFLKTLGPIVAAAGENLDGLVHQVNLDAVAVEFDLMDPAIAGRHFLDRRRQCRFDESGEGRFHADCRWLLTLKRHGTNSTNKTGRFKPTAVGSFRQSGRNFTCFSRFLKRTWGGYIWAPFIDLRRDGAHSSQT